MCKILYGLQNWKAKQVSSLRIKKNLQFYYIFQEFSIVISNQQSKNINTVHVNQSMHQIFVCVKYPLHENLKKSKVWNLLG